MGFDIEMTPAGCGYGLPLLGFRDASIVDGSAESDSDEAVYRCDGYDVRVDRLQEATVPVSGTFTLSSNGRDVEGKK